jgi:hypothetical protein
MTVERHQVVSKILDSFALGVSAVAVPWEEEEGPLENIDGDVEEAELEEHSLLLVESF